MLLVITLCGATLFAPVALRAEPLALAPLTCTGGAASASAAFALAPDDLECGPGRFEWRTRFVRTRSDVSSSYLPQAEALLWQTEPSAYASMLLRFTYADGSESLVDVDPQMAVRNWFAGDRFSVPVPRANAPLVAIDMVVERPQTIGTTRNARLLGADRAAREHYWRTAIYALVCGLLVIPIFYDLLFYRALRARFMLWHIAMIVATLAFALSNTGLIFALFPNMPLLVRWHCITLSMAVVIGISVLFTRKLLEENVVPVWLDRALIASALLILAVSLVSLVDIGAIRILTFHLLLLSTIPIIIAVVIVSAVALHRGSRSAAFVAVAFSGLVFVGLLRMALSFWPMEPAVSIDDLLLAGLVILALGTSAGAADRFVVIRLQRDRARLQAMRMGRMAHTDALTGIANRRAFDQIERLEIGQGLIAADIDHFKRINDTLGHQIGDAVLRHAANVLRRATAQWPDSLLFRLGGEEFAIVLACADRNRLAEISEHIRKCFEENVGEDDFDLSGLTVSIGAVLGCGQALHEAFGEADGAMYRAKDLGRNRWVLAPV